MISILIPVYNLDVNPLLETVFIQASALKIEFEIIIIDDCSTEDLPEVKLWNEHENIRRFKAETNQGRSNIRNLLVEKAQYSWVLFLDADTLPYKKKFIANYIDLIKSKPNESVVFGGLTYDENDLTIDNTLRYRYGIKRESKSLNQRMRRHPYTALLFSNTLVKKEVFNKVRFNPSIIKYGHEDAVMAWDLYKNNIAIRHVDNRVIHKGVENNELFLYKTKLAIENLLSLYNKGIINKNINKLLRYYERINGLQLCGVIAKTYEKQHQSWELKLMGNSPSLLLFDWYRLCYLCYLNENLKQLKK